MPKKTREEKMAAAIRRLKQQVAGQQIPIRPTVSSEGQEPESPPSTPETTAVPKQTLTPQGYSVAGLKLKSVPTVTPIIKEEERYNYTYVTADLRKIAVLAVAAIALEAILNLTTHASFAKLILRRFGIEI
jgi:hypothetical protein